MTGTSVADVNKMIKQAEKDRTIIKYKTVVNWDKIDDEQVWALIQVKVKPEPETGFDTIAGRLAHYDQVRSCSWLGNIRPAARRHRQDGTKGSGFRFPEPCPPGRRAVHGNALCPQTIQGRR